MLFRSDTRKKLDVLRSVGCVQISAMSSELAAAVSVMTTHSAAATQPLPPGSDGGPDSQSGVLLVVGPCSGTMRAERGDVRPERCPEDEVGWAGRRGEGPAGAEAGWA